jgi:C-terminal processing protease CtpA/Prc
MKRLLILILIILPFLGSCKKEVDAPEITPEQARDSLYFLMKSVYYWYKVMPSVDRENYANPYTLMEAMMYKPLDRWSFVADYDEFMAEMKGGFVGHGIRIGLDNTDQVRIVMIYKNSPLYAEGVRRGWIIKKINDIDLAPIMISHDAVAYNNAFGPSSTTVTNKFLFQKPDGNDITISSKKASFTINSVILYDTLHLSTGVTGHLVFESFIEPSVQELRTAFAFFNVNGVKDLIVDLRYNSGGYLYVAQDLASYIVGNGHTETNFATIEYNDKYQAYNQSFKFVTTSYPLSLSRVIFITSRLTASASEDVMNGIAPQMAFVSIGDTTGGKPMGSLGFPCGKKYIFSPITSKVTNSLGQGEFFDGFAPDKIAIDDIAHDFDDRNEKCLNEAIRYIETGTFSAKGGEAFRRSVQFSEKPSWMNNTFVQKIDR